MLCTQEGNGALARAPGGALFGVSSSSSVTSVADRPPSKSSLPDGVTENTDFFGTHYTFTVEHPVDRDNPFAPRTSDVVVAASSFEFDGRPLRSVDFYVNGRITSDQQEASGSIVANKVAQIFRHDVSNQVDGTVYTVSATRGDLRGEFRTASYSRAGLSFPGGSPDSTASSRGGQYGVVRGGKLIPSNERGKAFTPSQQAEHRQKVRDQLRAAVRAARDVKFGGKAPRVQAS